MNLIIINNKMSAQMQTIYENQPDDKSNLVQDENFALFEKIKLNPKKSEYIGRIKYDMMYYDDDNIGTIVERNMSQYTGLNFYFKSQGTDHEKDLTNWNELIFRANKKILKPVEISIYKPYTSSDFEIRKYKEKMEEFKLLTFGLNPKNKYHYKLLVNYYCKDITREEFNLQLAEYSKAVDSKAVDSKAVDSKAVDDGALDNISLKLLSNNPKFVWIPFNAYEYAILFIFGDSPPDWWKHSLLQFCYIKESYDEFVSDCSKIYVSDKKFWVRENRDRMESTGRYYSNPDYIGAIPSVFNIELFNYNEKIVGDLTKKYETLNSAKNRMVSQLWNILGDSIHLSQFHCYYHKYKGIKKCKEMFLKLFQTIPQDEWETIITNKVFNDYFKDLIEPDMRSQLTNDRTQLFREDRSVFSSETISCLNRANEAISCYERLFFTDYNIYLHYKDKRCKARNIYEPFLIKVFGEDPNSSDAQYFIDAMMLSRKCERFVEKHNDVIEKYLESEIQAAYVEWTDSILSFVMLVCYEMGWN